MGQISGFAASTNTIIDKAYYDDALHQDEYDIQLKMNDPLAFLASTQHQGDKDIMYYHQATREPDSEQFQATMLKEFKDHCTRKHWKLTKVKNISAGTKVLDAIWAMKCKRDIKTGEIYKWKARLNMHGGQQEKGVNFWEKYAPVVN